MAQFSTQASGAQKKVKLVTFILPLSDKRREREIFHGKTISTPFKKS